MDSRLHTVVYKDTLGNALRCLLIFFLRKVDELKNTSKPLPRFFSPWFGDWRVFCCCMLLFAPASLGQLVLQQGHLPTLRHCLPRLLSGVLLTSPAAGCKIISFMEENYLFALFLRNDNLLSVRVCCQLLVNGGLDIYCVSSVCRAKHFDMWLHPPVPQRLLIFLLFGIVIFWFLE